jgi:hypothetical protein
MLEFRKKVKELLAENEKPASRVLIVRARARLEENLNKLTELEPENARIRQLVHDVATDIALVYRIAEAYTEAENVT